MTAKINKAKLLEELTNKLGEEALEGFDLDDETLTSLLEVEEEIDEDEDEEEVDEIDEDDEDEEEEEDDLENIDVTKLTSGERMMYNIYLKEKKKAKQVELNALISTSGVGVKHKEVLKRMAKSGVGMNEIKKTIEDFKQVEDASTRILGRKKIVPKAKVKTKGKVKSKSPKVGSLEYGQFLAKKKKRK